MIRPISTSILIGVACSPVASAHGGEFSFSPQFFGPPSTLSIFVQSLDVSSGLVEINGADAQQSMIPFSWDWGDSLQTQGFFPQQHTYAEPTRNYVVRVTAHYPGGGTDAAETVVRFVAPEISPIQLPAESLVSIPASLATLTSRMPGYGLPDLGFFDDQEFSVVPRSTVEYVLSVAAFVQKDLVNGNVAKVSGGFQQVLLRDPALSGGGMYSLWFTDPVAFGAGAEAVSGTIAYSSFMHEMGHNFTLNSPAGFFYGGKIDGNANAIFSESMAQIFQHATAYEIINHSADYGLSDDLVADLKFSAVASMKLVRNSFDRYVQEGASFNSWNDPNTPDDETFDTFMTIAFKFFEHAETSGQGYRLPLKRMMQLLQILDQDMVDRYDQDHDTAAAEAFRATLMIAAVSHAFGLDLRPEFTALHFPIDDVTYRNLRTAVRFFGDVDFDNDVDLGDHRRLVECLGPLKVGNVEHACTDADLQADGVVDLLDFASLQNGFSP